MAALSVQQLFLSVFRKLRINIAVHIYVISQSPCTTKIFAQNIFIKKASWITDNCQIQSAG